jgi:hypothetical protein
MRKRAVTGALALATSLICLAPAEAGPYYYRRGWSPGGAAAVGVLSGLAIGSAIAASARPAPVYVAPPPPPEEECHVERRRVWVPGWGWELRRRTVCE